MSKTLSKQNKKTIFSRLTLWFSWIISFAVWAGLASLVLVIIYAYDLPDIEKAASAKRRPSITVIAEDGDIIATFGKVYGEPIQTKELPSHLIHAVLATEDRKFYDHHGIDIIGISRAFATNILAGRIKQGGSTITQQAAKNLFLSRERSIKRKIQELLLAFWLEHKFTKDQILTLYLNRVYFGSGTYGIEAASRRYYDCSAKDLSLYQSAVLAGLLKAPSRYNPVRSADAADKRAEQVLQNMVNAGYLTKKEAKNVPYFKAVPSAKRVGGGYYFADWILDNVSSYLGNIDQDITVKTTLNPQIQKASEKALSNKLKTEQGAIVVLDKNGAVKAMVGGRSYSKSQFNRAVQALRQPGSAFKPFVYLAAVEEGYRPNDMVEDRPVTIRGWKPKNYSKKYKGTVTLKDALAKSYNTVSASLAEQIGQDRVKKVARRLGITTNMTDEPALALGASEVKLIELTAAYTAFANHGFGAWTYGINEITDSKGNELYKRKGSGSGRLIKARHASYMNEMLVEVITNGTGKAANFGVKAGGKTGTSQNNRDAWFIGYTDEYIAGVWVGNDNGSPMKNVTGGGLPAKIWREIMKKTQP